MTLALSESLGVAAELRNYRNHFAMDLMEHRNMKYDLEGKRFRSLSNTENGEVGAETVFHYHQQDSVVWAEYEGGEIVKGHLVAKVLPNGQLDMSYHHINRGGEIMIGKCLSTPEFTSNGKLKFKEEWQWLNGDKSSGSSEIIEE